MTKKVAKKVPVKSDSKKSKIPVNKKSLTKQKISVKQSRNKQLPISIVQRDPKKINPADYNPRLINEKELAALTNSIKSFGFVEPLIINKKTGRLVGGHQRLKVAIDLELKTIPVVELTLTEVEEKALNVALNSHTLSGKFDEVMLQDLLQEIELDASDLFEDLHLDSLKIDVEDLDEYSDKNKEIDTDNFGNDLEHTCPKCGFEYNE